MKRPWIWVGVAAAAIVLAGGGFYFTRTQTTAQPQRPRDPGFALILSIRTLERTPETRLSKEQIAKALPFIKALKDVPPSDAEAAFAITRVVRETFTPEQRAALEEARRRFLERQRAQGAQAGAPGAGAEGAGPGAGGVPGAGTGVGPGAVITEEQRAQFRLRAFERMIRYLERRIR
jgi:hypothetical protein